MENKLLYKDMTKTLRKGDVILSLNRDSKLSGFIADTTNSDWSHTMLYVGNGFILESVLGGTKIVPLKNYCKGNYNLVVVSPRISIEQRKRVIEESMKLLGKRYGLLQMMWYYFIRVIGKSENPKWQLDLQPRAVVCSEAIALSFHNVGIFIKKGYKYSGIEPVDFYQSGGFIHSFEFKTR